MERLLHLVRMPNLMTTLSSKTILFNDSKYHHHYSSKPTEWFYCGNFTMAEVIADIIWGSVTEGRKMTTHNIKRIQPMYLVRCIGCLIRNVTLCNQY